MRTLSVTMCKLFSKLVCC